MKFNDAVPVSYALTIASKLLLCIYTYTCMLKVSH